jgi:hypothetical protein
LIDGWLIRKVRNIFNSKTCGQELHPRGQITVKETHIGHEWKILVNNRAYDSVK